MQALSLAGTSLSTAFNASDCSSTADDALELWRLNWTLSACMVHLWYRTHEPCERELSDPRPSEAVTVLSNAMLMVTAAVGVGQGPSLEAQHGIG